MQNDTMSTLITQMLESVLLGIHLVISDLKSLNETTFELHLANLFHVFREKEKEDIRLEYRAERPECCI